MLKHYQISTHISDILCQFQEGDNVQKTSLFRHSSGTGNGPGRSERQNGEHGHVFLQHHPETSGNVHHTQGVDLGNHSRQEDGTPKTGGN